ncbi:hypothetical protein [Sphingobacterium pedocola]|uniref:Uncharacterized protein n=1 Tax=Sphingobacterium pedocola TaxID=2082722 RepID=A0ABR9T3G6_9SPHI|nr:hypothetical protein [Sphingobacterium pedocola]MBE8719532.1 hypothetical protein [Sphingobacterium pedocola]
MDKQSQLALSSAVFFFIIAAPLLFGLSRLVNDPLSITSSAISASVGALIYFFLVKRKLKKKAER